MPRGGRGSARRRWGAAGLLGLALGGAQGAPGAPDPGGAPGGPSLAAFGVAAEVERVGERWHIGSTSPFLRTVKGFVINLPEDAERWKAAEGKVVKMLSRRGVETYRVRGVGGREVARPGAGGGWAFPEGLVAPAAQEGIDRGYRTSHGGVTVGSVGCSLSHFAIWDHMVRNDVRGALVFEDDAAPTDRLIANLEKYIDADDHILMLGSHIRKTSLMWKPGIVLTEKFFGAHAYYLTKGVARALLRGAFPIATQVDQYIGAQICNGVQVRAISPPAVRHEGEDSAVAEELNLDEEGLCEVLRDDWSLLDGDGDGCGTKRELVKFRKHKRGFDGLTEGDLEWARDKTGGGEGCYRIKDMVQDRCSAHPLECMKCFHGTQKLKFLREDAAIKARRHVHTSGHGEGGGGPLRRAGLERRHAKDEL